MTVFCDPNVLEYLSWHIGPMILVAVGVMAYLLSVPYRRYAYRYDQQAEPLPANVIPFPKPRATPARYREAA